MTKRQPKKVILVWATNRMDGATVVSNLVAARQKGYKTKLIGSGKTVTMKTRLNVQTDQTYARRPRSNANTLVINGDARNFGKKTDKFWNS